MSSRSPTEPETMIEMSTPEFDDAVDPATLVDRPSFERVLATLFDLGERDVETLEAIQAESGVTTESIADAVGRDRSNVSRSIARLRELGLVTRRRRIISSGGYFYEHYARSGEDVERVLTEAVHRWADEAADTLLDHSWEDQTGPFDD
ncbi:MAG: MarR family transcriptional regulator [Halobaculum sp.]